MVVVPCPEGVAMERRGTWLILSVWALLSAGAAGTPAAEPAREADPADWPQFHGPRRDNLSSDTNLLKRWPPAGPRVIWRAEGIGDGYATVAIAAGRIYTAGNIDRRTVITALDLSGKRLWRAENGPAYRRTQPGARATPTIAAGKLYHLNGDGDVLCLDARTGKRLWGVNILKRFAGRNVQWGLCESLLVDGGKVFCCPGGKEVGLAALDAETGKTVWTCTDVGEKPGYVSPIVVAWKGLRQVVTVMSGSAVGVSAETGKLLWKYPHAVKYEANIVTPIHHEGHLALFGTWGRGATLLRLHVDGQACTVKEVWRTTELDNEHGGVVLVDGHLYGQADGDHKRPHWACLELKTGKTTYSVKGVPGRSGSLTWADGMLYLLGDRGTVALVPPSPEGFRIVSRFQLPKQERGASWAHPVVCGGRLYLRHGRFLYAYDVRAK